MQYDVVGITPEAFEIKEQDSLTTSDSKTSDRSIHGNPADEKISQKENPVKQRFTADDATDAAYMQAVIDGDTETAQMMVEGAAAAAGLKGPYYHGTPHGEFTVFDGSRNGKRGSFASSQLGFFFTEDRVNRDGSY